MAMDGRFWAMAAAKGSARPLAATMSPLPSKISAGPGKVASASPPSASISDTAALRRSRFRLAMTTRAPTLANALAIPRPIPLPPPVINATRPANASEANVIETPFFNSTGEIDISLNKMAPPAPGVPSNECARSLFPAIGARYARSGRLSGRLSGTPH